MPPPDRTSLRVTVPPLPPDAPDSARSDQIERIMWDTYRWLKKHRGWRVARRYRRAIEALLVRNGTTYEQIRTALETNLNVALYSTESDLQEIVHGR